MMYAILGFAAVFVGALFCAGGRRPYRYYDYDRDIVADGDVDLYCDDNYSSDDYQDNAPATESGDD